MIAPLHIWPSRDFHKMIDSVVAGVVQAANEAGAKVSKKAEVQIRQSALANFNAGIIPAGNA